MYLFQVIQNPHRKTRKLLELLNYKDPKTLIQLHEVLQVAEPHVARLLDSYVAAYNDIKGRTDPQGM